MVARILKYKRDELKKIALNVMIKFPSEYIGPSQLFIIIKGNGTLKDMADYSLLVEGRVSLLKELTYILRDLRDDGEIISHPTMIGKYKKVTNDK